MLHIHLPEDYYRSDERYPVMYFFDGHNLFSDSDATYGTSWGLEDFLNSWVKPMIIVGIECGHEGSERLDEYSPYTFSDRRLGNVTGMGGLTLDWITGEIKPLIDRDYRTYYFREATGIGGSSMGGLMAFYGAVRYNRYFSKAACLSPSLIFSRDELMRDAEASELNPDTRIYISWGTKEAGRTANKALGEFGTVLGQCNKAAADLLDKKNIMTHIYCQEGGRHCEADWAKQVGRFMDYLWLQ